jgi:hypothetical protein
MSVELIPHEEKLKVAKTPRCCACIHSLQKWSSPIKRHWITKKGTLSKRKRWECDPINYCELGHEYGTVCKDFKFTEAALEKIKYLEEKGKSPQEG